jgi:hypothetical protein
LSSKVYPPKEEKRILDALGRGLSREFPNPNRVGCPGSQVLKDIASRKIPLAQAEQWLDHATSCSPCYQEFTQFREAYQRRRNLTLLAVAASVLVVASIGGWALMQRHGRTQIAQTAVLDLRNRSVARGTQPVPTEPPLEIRRTVSRFEIYLPIGSSEGPYDVRIVTPLGASLQTASGIAKLKDHITSLRVTVSLSSARPGPYILQIRKAGLEWNSYPLLLR